MDNSKQKLKNIISGWKNTIIRNPLVEQICENRATICSKCKYNVRNICKKCGCPLIAKTRSKLPSCPLKKWPL